MSAAVWYWQTKFQHTAARRRLQNYFSKEKENGDVSTHSRTKAAALDWDLPKTATVGFNTQPHEGGCNQPTSWCRSICKFQHTAARRRLRGFFKFDLHAARFQHTAARRRLHRQCVKLWVKSEVSTHSRTKAAAVLTVLFILSKPVSTHSRTKAAAAYLRVNQPELFVSTHSRTKAAAPQPPSLVLTSTCFNTQPHEGGCDYDIKHRQWDSEVSTHSRTKAAALV